MSENDERLWAALAHASIWLNLATGLIGVIAPLVIYLAYKDRSKYVAGQAMQAFVFQLVWWIGGGLVVAVAWISVSFLSIFLIGLLCIPVAIIISFIPLAALVYGTIAALQSYEGKDFRYWLISDWVTV